MSFVREQVLGLELRVGVADPHLDRVAVEHQPRRYDTVALEDVLHADRLSAPSTLTVALALETCTAGAPPRKFGSVYSRPNASASPRAGTSRADSGSSRRASRRP
jgi:hypothetical protein